jgi:hypothetical protein
MNVVSCENCESRFRQWPFGSGLFGSRHYWHCLSRELGAETFRAAEELAEDFMDQVVIFFVPVNATERDFEAALREYIPSLEITARQPQAKPADFAQRSAEESPLWTWFLPNPCP